MRFNKKTKRFIGAVLLIAAVLLVFSLLVNKEEDYDRTFTTWTVGAIDEDGNYDSTLENMMVSGLIEAHDGIKIIPNFTAGVYYTVYGYNEEQGYIDEFPAFGGSHDATFVLDELGSVYYIRIVMTPDDDNGKITEFEKLIYATQLEIYTQTTNKNN